MKVALEIIAGRMDLEHCVGSHKHSEAHGDAAQETSLLESHN